jgi:glycosyltransferase 2 family protein
VSKETRQGWVRLGWFALLGGLLWIALQNAPLVDIWASLQRLTLGQLAIIFILDVIVCVLVTMRWWIIVCAESSAVPLLPLVGYRMAAFALSYFTPGPQVGGEPLQVLYLQKNYGLGYVRATSAVIMDKLIEFLTNFLFLGIGLYAVSRVGIFSGNEIKATVSMIPLVALLLWPLAHIILLYNRRFPLSTILRVAQARFGRRNWIRLLMVSERMAGAFCRRHPQMLLASLGVSLLSWIGMAFEYSLMARFLQISLDLWQVLAALTALQLAFLLPLPAGLGALELSQVLVMRALGLPDALGISLSLLMRARDLFNGGIGLLVASRAFNL